MNDFVHPCLDFRFVPFTMEYGQEICHWQYEPPYDLYNWGAWETLEAAGDEFADPYIRETQFSGVLDENGRLIGFVQFFPIVGVTRLGLGLRPDLCGSGNGATFAQACAEEALRRKPLDAVDLEVLVWNDRARKAYERAGFRITDRYERKMPDGMGDFFCMEYICEKDVESP
ncbi:GNAT family N-acetyltransferase [Gorillibacterium massiliense]|uniref:GNAT family N-acetyltransferase n=1 Tax=Gorillibacterium massiliense TaxID=1280390 RepID=UPI0004B263D2|nr:GNAT family N-acetyltransferase [Gorillibacterium massiliense]